MNHVLYAAAETIQTGAWAGLSTAFFLGFFTTWAWWTYLPSNRAAYESAAHIPLEED